MCRASLRLGIRLRSMEAVDAESLTLDDLTKLSVLGTGATSTVWLVQSGDEYYALKEVPKARVAGKKQLQHVMSERHLLRTVRCPHTIRFHRTLKDAENLYFLTEVAGGGDLATHMRRAPHSRLPESRVRTYAAELIIALRSVHAAGAVYRDMKASNVVLDATGRTRLIDFGLSKVVDTKELNGRTLTWCGTPHAMAPEMMLRDGHGKAVDWWGLGVLVYELVVGTPPFGTSLRPISVDGSDAAAADVAGGGGGGASAAGGGLGGAGGAGAGAAGGSAEGEEGNPKLAKAIAQGASAVLWPEDVFGVEPAASPLVAFISELLQPEEAKRLGAGGPEQVMKHAWLADINWSAVEEGRSEPAPWDKSLAEFLSDEDAIDPDVDAALFGDF